MDSREMRDDEECGEENGVKTSEQIENNRYFLDEDGRVSINTFSIQFGVGVATSQRFILEDMNMCKDCAHIA